MTAYEFIFESSLTITFFLVIIALIPLFFAKSTFVARSLLYSFGAWLPSVFYLFYIIAKQQFVPAIMLALLVEVWILFIFLILFAKMLRATAHCQHNRVMQLKTWLKVIIIFYLLAYIPLLFNQGYGLFSSGSRIQYLEDSRLSRYATYFCLILSVIAVPVAAAIINHVKKWDRLIIFFLFISFLTSLLAGSKGGFLLTIISLMSLIQLSGIRDYMKILWVPIIAIVVGVFSTVIFVGNFLSLDTMQMINLMFSRFFLNNDARALSIDFSDELGSGGANLFQESFRGLYSRIGYPPINLPLGQLLSQIAFSTSDFSGGNTSSTALLIAFGNGFEKVVFALCLFLFVFIILVVSHKTTKYYIPKLALALLLINFLSQDFLAFPLVINILVGFMFIYFLISSIRHVLQSISVDRRTNIPLNYPQNPL